MSDTTDYAKEMSTPAHKPGMQNVVNRGPQHAVPSEGDARDSDGNRQGPRRTVSPPTQSAFGPASASDPAPAAAAKAAPSQSTSVSGIGGRMREQQIMDTVDKAAGSGDNE
jgi:hypothetical protein